MILVGENDYFHFLTNVLATILTLFCKTQLQTSLDQMEDRSLLTLERVPSSPLSSQAVLTKSNL